MQKTNTRNSSSRSTRSVRNNKSIRSTQNEAKSHSVKFDRFGKEIKNDRIVVPVRKQVKEEKRSFLSKRRPTKTKTVYIGNLNYNIDETGLLGIFSKFGKVKAINIIRDKKTEKSKGIAFIEMVKADDADIAIKTLDGKLIDRRTIKVSEAIENGVQKSDSPAPKKASSKSQKRDEEEKIVLIKKERRVRGLDQLFKNTGRK